MTEQREILAALAKRALVAVPVWGFGWYLLASATGGWSAMGRLIFGMAFLLTGAIIISPALARVVAEPAGNLFYPGRRFDRPQPAYGIPESQRKKGQFDHAFAGFQQIAAEHPQELKAYVAMIDIAVVDLRRPELAESVYTQAQATLRNRRDRASLHVMYEAITSRLPELTAPPPRPVHMPPPDSGPQSPNRNGTSAGARV